MFESMKPLNWLESRIANFPKATKIPKNTKTIELVDIWGKKHTYTAHYAKKSINPFDFDGCGVIRNKVDKDGDYSFLTVDIIGLMANWFTKNINTRINRQHKFECKIPDINTILGNCQIDLWKNRDGSITDCFWSPNLKRYIDAKASIGWYDGDYYGNIL